MEIQRGRERALTRGIDCSTREDLGASVQEVASGLAVCGWMGNDGHDRTKQLVRRGVGCGWTV